MKPLVILENIRSCYNVGSIIRTADALGWDVAIVGYTPSPRSQPKVSKTSLGAEESVRIDEFIGDEYYDTTIPVTHYQGLGYYVVAAEVTQDAVILGQEKMGDRPIALIMGNEVTGVSPHTLSCVDAIVKIPMRGKKESLNVSQAAAILMREIAK